LTKSRRTFQVQIEHRSFRTASAAVHPPVPNRQSQKKTA
jgi:hypothetical protein